MESINYRVALIIEKLGMTKTAIAKRLKVSQQYISKLTTTGTPSERLIDDICREFNINEDWLRTGAGGEENMFIPDDMQYFQNVGKLGNEKNEFKKFYLNMMMGLPDEYWDYIYKEFKKFEEKKEE
ncbi:XRE family transcriptional regulator [Lacrimispora amygdalina]|uniref:XRE family transcriptional regulator n=1 Tax=Lacrimispora amygdalina TaxID=253257 RepID=A0A3E2NG41_9FIRM|nr:helix-turn-helix transcriptional regulator [Clostridium indicum]RFZ79881.1 XRE family transcriptional regulator [Clostridium indicum]